MEILRKRWDMNLAYIELAEKAATCPANPESVRKMRGEWAKRERATLKERP